MNYEELKQKYDKVPAEIKAMKRWVGFRVEGMEDGKTAKRPYNSLSGKYAKSNDSLSWSSFDIALRGCVKYNFDGIGFMLGEGIFGVDLDNHPDKDGNFPMNEDEFKEFSNMFMDALDSYSEYSQSGKGIHIICKGKLPAGARKKSAVEMYDDKRFFAFTGNVVRNQPINNREQEIVPLWEKYINTTAYQAQEHVSRKIPTNRQALILSDEEIINIAVNSKNGGDFWRLYHDGDLTANNGDKSAADMSLCNMLAFWCACDTNQMDRIFRNSALFREKWDEYRGEKTYGEITLETAVNSCQNVYQKTVAIETPTHNYTVQDKITIPKINDDGEVVQEEVPVEMNIDENGEPIFRIRKNLKKYPYTDTGNALRFYDYFGNIFKYNVTDKIFMFWTGKVWEKDVTCIIRKYANKLIDILNNEKATILESISECNRGGKVDEAKHLEADLDQLTKNITRISNKAGKDAMLAEFQSLYDVAIESSEFDKEDYLLNTDSGIVNLDTNEVMMFDRNMLMSKKTECKVSYEEPKVWLEFLHSVFKRDSEKDTQEIIDSLQTCLGYSLTGSTKEQVMFLLYGGGSNGKSTLTEQIAYMLGTYGDNISSSVLMQQKNMNSSAIYSIAKLQNKRFVETGETDEGGRIAEGQVKILTGGDSISAQFKYGNEFSFRPRFKIWMSTNNKPIIRGTDLGIWRRLFLFPFENTFTEAQKDKNLPDKLKAETDKILGWCIKGYQKYKELGDLIRPECLKQAATEYKEQMDVVTQFLNKECCVADTAKIDCKVLYQRYKEWSSDNTEYTMKESKFAEELKKKGITIKKSALGSTIYIGVKVNGIPEHREY